MDTLAAVILILVGAMGSVLAVLGLPGIWLMLAAATITHVWWRPDLLSPTALIIVLVLGVLGEVAEITAGALGARRAGGSRRASVGALIGGLIGALTLGPIMIPLPIIGPIIGVILGSAIGAGVGAVAMELTVRPDPHAAPRPRSHSIRVGGSAMVARLIASILKGACGFLAWGVLIASVLIGGF